MSGPVLGIDLGTTNSVVAVADGGHPRVLDDDEGYKLIPSVVSFHPSGEILVGRPARERRLLDAKNTVYSVKRLIGRPFRSEEVRRARERFPFELREGPTGGVLVAARNDTYTLSEISAFVLRQVRSAAERRTDTGCTRAVVTVPANFNELQRSATKAAGRVAGLDVLRILNEPTAAALAYGYGRGSREKIAIFDLGGGTFDITILELSGDVFEVLATAGDTYLGGDDIDVLISEQMADAFLEHHRYDAREDQQAYERLRAAAEWAKCQLSLEEEVQLRVEELAYGDGGVSLDLGFALDRGTLERMAQPLVARCFDVCEDAMRVAGIRPTQLDNVILVGGSTRIPLVHKMVTEYFGREPLANIDPDLVVAQGAAIQGSALLAPSDRKALGRVRLKRVTRAELQGAKQKPAQEAPGPVPITQQTTVPGTSGPPPVPEWPGDETDTAVREPAAQGSADEVPTAVHAQKAIPVGESVGGHRAQRPSGGRTLPMDGTAPTAEQAGRGPVQRVPKQPAFAPERPQFEPEPELPGAAELGPAPGVEPEPAGPGGPPPIPVPVPSGASAEPPPVPGPPAGAAPPPVPPGPPAGAAPPPVPPTPQGPGAEGPAQPPPLPPRPEPQAQPPAAPQAEPPAPPLLLDVTPQTLGIETVGGYCEAVIKRNAAIPVEHTRIFTTAQDNQEVVRVRICQGESRRLDDNQGLGEIELSGLRPAARGQVQIGVTFLIGADGTLGVRAQDLQTGRQQMVHIKLVGGVSDEEVQRMQQRQEQLMGQGG